MEKKKPLNRESAIGRISFGLLSVLIGAVFLFSGYTKLYPIEPFEYTFVDLGVGNWQTAPFVARILIGLEFLIGFALVIQLQLKKITYKLGIVALIVFSMYLILEIIFSGNKGNCGCFGTTLFMTPLQALMKNSVMLVILILLYKFHNGWGNGKFSNSLYITLCISSVVLPFILNPVELSYSEAYLNKPENHYKLELDSLYVGAKLTIPPKTLSQGKHIIAFISLTCQHCRIASKKMHIMHERNTNIPFYFVLNGNDENLKPFFDDTHTEEIPHCILLGKNFVFLAGTNMPAIYLINNSMVEHEVNYLDLDQKEVEFWLDKK
ncbi:MAG: hypothetical protein EPN85_12780 [Bacteroidetes bacterium]|nr:MAG: hypothetical protein EPN85_12780 [Bacteroidota bacterium]